MPWLRQAEIYEKAKVRSPKSRGAQACVRAGRGEKKRNGSKRVRCWLRGPEVTPDPTSRQRYFFSWKKRGPPWETAKEEGDCPESPLFGKGGSSSLSRYLLDALYASCFVLTFSHRASQRASMPGQEAPRRWQLLEMAALPIRNGGGQGGSCSWYDGTEFRQ